MRIEIVLKREISPKFEACDGLKQGCPPPAEIYTLFIDRP